MRDQLSDPETGQSPADPMKAAQEAMRAPLPRRFYEAAGVAPEGEGHAVQLDGRTARTPGRAPLVLASESAAQLVADEFAAQGETIDPATMPCYRLVNTATDGVAADPQAVLEDVVRFFGTDLLCYRAGEPEALVAAQRETWDGPLAWAEEQAGSRFALAEGIMHVAQPRETLAAMGVHLRQITDPVVLAALHSMTTLTGSAILAFGTLRGAWSADEAWTAAHVDEDFNIAQWGEDAEAKAHRARRWTEMDAAARMVAALAGQAERRP